MSVTQTYKTITISANMIGAMQELLRGRIIFFNEKGLSEQYNGLIAESRALLKALDAPSAPAPASPALSAESIEQIDLALWERRVMIFDKLRSDRDNDYWVACLNATNVAIDEVAK